MSLNDQELIAGFEKIIGKTQVITAPDDLEPYLVDWRKRYRGKAIAALRPGNTQEVSEIVKLCAANRIAIVPQGGNTGLCGGATPNSDGRQVVVSLNRMNQVRAIDTSNQTITVEAGMILQSLQEAATAADRYFPLSLGAEGSCTIGAVITWALPMIFSKPAINS